MKTRAEIQKEFEKEITKKYPQLKYSEEKLSNAWDDVRVIEKSDQGSSSFNANIIHARDIEYVWIVEKYARMLKKGTI
jgi:hypothetical protein